MKLYDLSRRMCEWDELTAWRQRFRGMLEHGDMGQLSPFTLLALPGIRADEQRVCAELWMARRLASSKATRDGQDFQFHTQAARKIRIGYLSCDFHEHATALLLIEVFENHDRDRFEVFAYSYGDDDGGGMRQRLEHTFERFVNIQGQSMSEAAVTINGDGIDILIDLKGFTRDTRTEILSFHPAPVQVNYLGYPGTLGGDLCDYIVTDRFLTPPETSDDYSESFAYLPDSYQPHSRYSTIDQAPTRAAAGLPEDGFVFCCFNQSYKITPEIFDVWCELLSHCPGSVLWLLSDKMAIGNLRNLAMQRGVLPDRLIFAEHTSQSAHLGRLQLADLVLDTLPYNAHTTASDALWAGVPVVTCAGDTFASRVAGSLLRAIELPELVTHDLQAYFDLALSLASDPQRHAVLKTRLAANRLTTPLFDIERYTRHLESLYEQMWSAHLEGRTPQAIQSGVERVTKDALD